jgi:hypothetical protein
MRDKMNQHGFGKLLTPGFANMKIAKGEGGAYLSTIMHLSPHKASGAGNVCASASAGCIAACLNTAGRGVYDNVQMARKNRTLLWFQNRPVFMSLLREEMHAHRRKAIRENKIACFRLNGTSDLIWERAAPELFEEFSDCQFYDYTKHAGRCLKKHKLPKNYHLTFSMSEVNRTDCRRVLRSGKCNVAVVFGGNPPPVYLGRPTFTMDENDLRFLDPPGGCIGALTAKGKAKRDKSGFVIRQA